MPFILRKTGRVSEEDTYQVVGGAYVQGVMDGEAVRKLSGHENDSHTEA